MAAKRAKPKKPARPARERRDVFAGQDLAPKVDPGYAPAPQVDRGRVTVADRVEAYREVFSSRAGQIVYADLERHFGFTRQSTIPTDGNPYHTARHEGQRMVMVHIGRQVAGIPVDSDEDERSTEYDPT